MKILFDQTGGLAGINITSSVDTNSLPREEKERLEEIINSTNFFNLPSNLPPPKNAADYYRYNITVEEDEHNCKHTVELTDLSMLDGLKPLIKIMRKRALQTEDDNSQHK